jgi:hypothetical protein
LPVFGFEKRGDVIQEISSSAMLFVVGWLQVAAKLIRSEEELRLEAKVSAIAVRGG